MLFLRLFCGFVVPGAPEGSTGRRFLEKPGIEHRCIPGANVYLGVINLSLVTIKRLMKLYLRRFHSREIQTDCIDDSHSVNTYIDLMVAFCYTINSNDY